MKGTAWKQCTPFILLEAHMATAGTALDELVAEAETPTPVGEDEGGHRHWVQCQGLEINLVWEWLTSHWDGLWVGHSQFMIFCGCKLPHFNHILIDFAYEPA